MQRDSRGDCDRTLRLVSSTRSSLWASRLGRLALGLGPLSSSSEAASPFDGPSSLPHLVSLTGDARIDDLPIDDRHVHFGMVNIERRNLE